MMIHAAIVVREITRMGDQAVRRASVLRRRPTRRAARACRAAVGLRAPRAANSRPGSDPNAPRTGSGGLIRRAGPPPDTGYESAPSRATYRPNTPQRGQRSGGSQAQRGGYDDGYGDEDNGTGYYTSEGRSVGDRARDFTRNMSRQLELDDADCAWRHAWSPQ